MVLGSRSKVKNSKKASLVHVRACSKIMARRRPVPRRLRKSTRRGSAVRPIMRGIYIYVGRRLKEKHNNNSDYLERHGRRHRQAAEKALKQLGEGIF